MTEFDSDNDRIARAALEWLIALQENPGDEALRRQFDDWRASSQAHADAWDEVLHMSGLVEQAANIEETGDTPAGRRKPAHRPRLRLAAMGAAAVAAAVLLVTLVPTLLLHLKADYITGAGEVRRVELADGSAVHLGASSAIRLDYDTKMRRVGLLSGQAFFDVARNSQRPFKVTFGGAESTVLGTAFEVRLLPGNDFVAVRQGSVRVSQDRRDAPGSELKRGDSLRLGRDGKMERGSVEPDQVAAWLQGKMVVRNRPVREVIETLRRHYGGLIVQGQPGLGDKQVTGVYDLHDPVGALRAVAIAHGATVRQITPWVVVISGI